MDLELEPITVELVETNVFARWPCTVCGGQTEKVAILAEGQDEHGSIRVCENCLEQGGIDERLQKRAVELEIQAELVRKLIGRLKVPTFTEWCRAERDFEVRGNAPGAIVNERQPGSADQDSPITF